MRPVSRVSDSRGPVDTVLLHIQTEGWKAIQALAMPAPFFIVLAFATKGRHRLVSDIIKAARQTRINLLVHFTDMILVAPLVLVTIVVMRDFFTAHGLSVVPVGGWKSMPVVVTGIVAVVFSDFIGYWRHRLEHTALLWPSHAVHHSDDEMTWLAIFRFHPINRFSTTIIDFSFLLLMGLPAYALMVAIFVKHNYGAFIHADLPWTFGRLGYIFVSPAMHRWHHAKDSRAYNTNYATVISVFDLAFGTFRVPGRCDVPLGVPDRMSPGFIGQMVHPFKPSSYRMFLGSLLRSRSKRA